jgi:hypothetical protein
MTPRELITHLCDVYMHVSAKSKGEEAGWNQYVAPERTEDLMADFDSLRAKAVSDCLASNDPYELATDYIIVHDAYHVGQLCTSRISVEPGWDPYAIYR